MSKSHLSFFCASMILFTCAAAPLLAQETPAPPPPPPPPAETPPPTPPPTPPASEEKPTEEKPPTPPADLPAAKRIIFESLQAIGGQERADELKSFAATATLDAPMGGQIVLTVKSLRNGAFHLVQRMSEIPDSESTVVFDGKHGWVRMPTGEYQVVDKPLLESGRREFNILYPFWYIFDPEGRFKSFETVERTTFNEKDCYKVRLVAEGDEGLQRFGFYGVEDKRIEGMRISQETPLGPMQVDFAFRQWKEIDGRWLFTIMVVTRADQPSVDVVYTDITFNTVEDSAFAKPAEVITLIEQQEKPPALEPAPGSENPPATPPAPPPPAAPPVPPPPSEPE